MSSESWTAFHNPLNTIQRAVIRKGDKMSTDLSQIQDRIPTETLLKVARLSKKKKKKMDSTEPGMDTGTIHYMHKSPTGDISLIILFNNYHRQKFLNRMARHQPLAAFVVFWHYFALMIRDSFCIRFCLPHHSCEIEKLRGACTLTVILKLPLQHCFVFQVKHSARNDNL